jgi:GAF domain-containing protein/anti-sigma regulatory factor (Ser/Thr protein kinase)
VAALVTAGALTVSAALAAWTESPAYAPLIGAVAISVWVGGWGSGLLSIAVGWTAAWVVLVDPRLSVDPTHADVARLLVSFSVALLIVWVGWAMRIAESRAAERAASAERAQTSTEALAGLASALSSAVSPSDVAHALVERVPPLLGATGAALGLIDDDTLRIVDPEGAPRQTLAPGLRLPLATRAPITTAARTSEPAYASSREEFERDYPDGARLAPAADAALAVPLISGGAVVGAMGMPFASGAAIDSETVALARVAAQFGGQALERAGLYEQERISREGLDRIVRLAPRFAGESPERVLAAICAEAREALGADVAQVWSSVSLDTFEVRWRDPPSDVIPPGTQIDFADFPGLTEAMERLEALFVADAQENVKGLALQHAKAVGVRSSLRVPIVIDGVATRVLTLQWHRVVAVPQAATMVLARRFADQAGLALEHAERRLAQETAARNAEETRRLLDVTAALAGALTPRDVADAALREAVRAFQASAGVAMRLVAGAGRLELIESTGYADIEDWQRFDADARHPLADAVRRNEIVALESPAERRRRYPRLTTREPRHAAWLSVPLTAAGRAVGVVGLAFDASRTFGDTERAFAFALARQAGQALERATLHQAEHEARTRAEQMAGDLAKLHHLSTQLHRAASLQDIAQLVAARISGIVGADGTGVYLLDDGHLKLLDAVGAWSQDMVSEHHVIPLDDVGPVGEAVRERVSRWSAREEDWERYAGGTAWRSSDVGTIGAVPLAIEERAVGALLVMFRSGRHVDDERRRFVETVARQVAQPLERARLLDQERASRRAAEHATERVRRLHAATAALSRAGTARQVGLAFLTTAIQSVGATSGAVLRLGGDGDALELIAALDDSTGVALDLADAGRGALRVRAPVWPVRSGRGEAGPAAASLPLEGRGGVLGVAVLAFGSAPEIGSDDRELLVALAAQCAQALERSRLYDDERVSRRRSDRLQALTAALSGALTTSEVAEAFLGQAREAVAADGAAIGVVDHERRTIRIVESRGYEAAVAPLAEYPVGADLPQARAFRRLKPSYHLDLEGLAAEYPAFAEAIDVGHRSFAFMPLVSAGNALGVAMFSWRRATEVQPAEKAFLETLASQCAQALDRARRYETERMIAETLQRSILPETLPSMEGVQVSARYLPGTAVVDVGGDWYDTIPLQDGRLAFVVGDVVGKGVVAASTMAQLRNGLRALALDANGDGTTVTKLNRLIDGYTDAPFATLAYVALDPRRGAVSVISAGHLPPLVVPPVGAPAFLEQGRGLPLGVDRDAEYVPWCGTLDPGSLILLFTDGLVERRDRSLDEGFEQLVRVAAVAPRDPEQFVDAVIADLVGDQDRGDDIAVLALRLDPVLLAPLETTLPSRTSSLLVLREALRSWLARAAIPEVDARDIVLATWEAAANAIEHARNPSADTIRIDVSLKGDLVRVRVSDTGRWREPQSRPDRGLGLHVMKSLMSQLEIERADGGTRLVMERALTRERAGERAGTTEG